MSADRIGHAFKEPQPDSAGEYETFGDDERLVREHAEYFVEEVAGWLS